MAGNEGVVFLGWRIQRHHERGAGKSYVYIYPAKKGAGRRHGQGEDTLSAEHEAAAQRSAASA
jgi:hypothetical protein